MLSKLFLSVLPLQGYVPHAMFTKLSAREVLIKHKLTSYEVLDF